jgi:hypothetical protein
MRHIAGAQISPKIRQRVFKPASNSTISASMVSAGDSSDQQLRVEVHLANH